MIWSVTDRPAATKNWWFCTSTAWLFGYGEKSRGTAHISSIQYRGLTSDLEPEHTRSVYSRLIPPCRSLVKHGHPESEHTAFANLHLDLYCGVRGLEHGIALSSPLQQVLTFGAEQWRSGKLNSYSCSMFFMLLSSCKKFLAVANGFYWWKQIQGPA